METGMTAALPERRNGRRRGRSEEYGLVSARVRPGHDIEVLDVSSGGVLVESSQRLLPGATVELHLQPDAGPPHLVRGRVLRCYVARLHANLLSYRGAIAFEPTDGVLASPGSYGVPQLR
jgi:hypothetical protein